MRRSSAGSRKGFRRNLREHRYGVLALGFILPSLIIVGCGDKGAAGVDPSAPPPVVATPPGPAAADMTPAAKDADGPIRPGDPVTPGREPVAGG